MSVRTGKGSENVETKTYQQVFEGVYGYHKPYNHMTADLKDRVALITGASGMIGGATAEPMNDAATNPVSGTTETEQTTVQEEVVDGSSIPVEIKADVTIEKFAADNKISADTFKKLNKDSLPPDGMLRTGSIVFIPSAE